MSHTCHATQCFTAIPPKLFMCRRHWFMVPPEMRRMIWSHYVLGQEVTKTPTPAYLNAARIAQEYVAAKEGKS